MSRPAHIAVLSLSVAVTGILAAPLGSQAAVTVGSALDPGGITTTNACNPCTFVPTTVDSTAATAPFNGVIVRWGVRSKAPQQTVNLRVVRQVVPDHWIGVSTGPVETTSGTNDANFFANYRIPIVAGDYVGADATGPSDMVSLSRIAAGSDGLLFDPPGLPAGGAPLAQAPVLTLEPLVQATIEPDADGDGFGDESQDGCPTNAQTQGPCPLPAADPPGADTTAPVISDGPTARPRAFAVTRVKRSGKAARRKLGTTLSYSLSEAATATFTVQGRSRCARKSGTSKRKRCRTRHRRVGSFRHSAAQGANSKRFAGKVRGKKLRPGRYRAVVVAKDAAGNRSKRKSVAFTILRAARR